MIAFTVLLGSTVTFLLPAGILLMRGDPQSLARAAVWLFFIVMGPGVASPVYKLTFLGGNTKEIDEGVARIDRILAKAPVPEPACPEVPRSYDVEFRHVSFSYENTEQGTRTEALHDVCFTAPQGRITALVGPSGSGKSTVANLIPRFWDAAQGEVLIGGVNIRNIAAPQLMDTVSFVFQDTFLFYDTLYENIAVGSPSATKATVMAAAEAARCHEFIERLPQGYETRIGDEGVGRRGAADMRGPRHSEECADTGAGRSHGLRRPRERIQDAAGLASPHKGQDRDRHRPPSVVRRLGGQHRGHAAGADRAAGQARRLILGRGSLQEDVGCLHECLSLDVEQKLNTAI